MKIRRRIGRTLSLLLFSIGVLVAMGLSGIAFSADLEAFLFKRELSYRRDTALRTLRCPVMITTSKSGTVSAAFRNPLDKPVDFAIHTYVSEYLTMSREIREKLPVEPGERERIEWTVTADDAVQGNLVLVKVLQLRRYPIPARLSSCGILVVDLPGLTGNQVFAAVLAISLLGMAGGIGLWVLVNRPLSGLRLDVVRAMAVVTGSTLAGLIASLLGAWLIGAIALAINLLLIGAVVGHFIYRLRR